jgi:predicted TIM-barrel fold metal-dependent hydrolase
MDFTGLESFSILDAHIHYGHPSYQDGLIRVLDRLGIGRANIVCTPDQRRLSLVPDALHLKAHYPERITVFGGLDISPLLAMPEQAGQFYADYVPKLLDMGCDGIKMIEGKPQLRQMLPIPDFDSSIYAPYWEVMAGLGIPLLFHVNDPEEFWDARRVPGWAVERGWFYGNGDFIDNEEQYRQVLAVLDRHSNLKVIFAHFFFLSAQLPRLAGYLDAYPNMCIDLTPGVEMYFNFSANVDAVRDFFITYQDRIVYGTDIGAKALLATPEQGIEAAESESRVFLIRHFLEDDGPFTLKAGSGFLFGKEDATLHGINLPAPVLEKIYARNFERLVGDRPRPLNPALIAEECDRLAMMIGMMGAAQPGQTPDPSVALMVKAYFEALA